MPLRLRLALLLAGLVALVTTGASMGVHQTVSAATRSRMQQELRQEADDLIAANAITANAAPSEAEASDAAPALIVPPGQANHPSHIEWFTSACQDLSYFTDQIANSVASGKMLPLSATGREVIRAGNDLFETQEMPDESGLHMVYNKPIMRGNRVIGLAQVAGSVEDTQLVLGTLSIGLLVGGVVLTIGSFAGVWIVAGKTLRPLRRLTNAVDSVRDQHNFDHSLLITDGAVEKTARGRDEIGQLTQSVTSMLSEMQLVHQNTESHLDYQRRFLADVSHELRTPLTTINGNLRLLRRDLSEEDRTAVLNDAIDETERMTRLLHKLLATARGEQHLSLHCTPLAMASVLDDVMRKVGVLNGGQRVISRVIAHPIVRGDADALKQVLLILIDNALKYTPADGQITVTLRCERGHAQISVLDTGPGMDAEQMQHIFERFYRGEGVRHTNGAGLGLAIAKDLVNAHGGHISVASQRGHGSEFTVTLPAI